MKDEFRGDEAFISTIIEGLVGLNIVAWITSILLNLKLTGAGRSPTEVNTKAIIMN